MHDVPALSLCERFLTEPTKAEESGLRFSSCAFFSGVRSSSFRKSQKTINDDNPVEPLEAERGPFRKCGCPVCIR
jgi:hypothetical protein